ncbi:gamma-glutamyltransferase, partial [Pseudoalteromonas sp. 5-MNA-CIBAN-0065]
LVQPAVTLAEQGFIVPPKLAKGVSHYIAHLKEQKINVNFEKYFADVKANKVFKQPELAATLKRIRDNGQDGFYKGETANIIAKFMHQHGGII